MDKLWKNNFVFYKKEMIFSLIFLYLIFQYILNFAQNDIRFTGVSGTWGMWCRICYSTTNVFWFGASYWILFAAWIREIYIRNVSLLVIARTENKRTWTGKLFRKGMLFASLYPVIHFLLLCMVNLYLYGWNAPDMENMAFQKLFLGMGISEAVFQTLFLRMIVSMILVIVIWILFLLSHHVTIAVLSSLLFCFISIIMVSADSFGYYLLFPAGVSFFYLLVGGKTVFMVTGSFLVGGVLAVCLIQKYLVSKMEIQKFQ